VVAPDPPTFFGDIIEDEVFYGSGNLELNFESIVKGIELLRRLGDEHRRRLQ
jgi:hypothetical protein